MLHSIYDLTTFCRKTTGDVPAKLVGASTTVVGSKMYLFGGRLVTERKMVSDLYVFDLESFNWERVPISPEDDVPRARYFHSADTWNNQLIIFGGMSNQPDSLNPDELCVLNDVRFFDLASRRWLPAAQPSPSLSDPSAPRARYAHLSSVTADRLFIIGGQDFNNTWLDDVCVYDLPKRAWVQRRDYPRHCGTYRSVAVASHTSVRQPQEEIRNSQSAATLGPPGQRFGPDPGGQPPAVPPVEFTPTESLVHLPYSAPPSESHPSDIYLYSNYNFTDVKRELEIFSPLPDYDFTIQDKSSAMSGTTFPPGLRFPTGAILGNHLIIAGTYLAHSYQSFSIWALDLTTMVWMRIDPGKAVESGSWFRGCLWAEANKFLIFGNRVGNLVDDYNRRLLSWDHVAVVDLEAFGIYQPPPLALDITMQELGLAALEERVVADFEIICDDGRRIACSRKVLEERWPWFKDQRRRFLQTAKQALEGLPTSAMHIGLPDVPGTAAGDEPRVDPRLTPRAFHLSEPYPITLALLQYFYTTALVTPLQHAPAVLSQLLVLATTYEITHLVSLVKHAMHRALSNSTSVGVYEVATLCSCRSLQIRALKTVMSYTQKRPSRSRGEKDGGSGKPPGGAGGGGPANGGGGGGSGSESQYISRPRGTSDARWRTIPDSSANNTGYNSRGNVIPVDITLEDQITPLPVLSRQRSRRRTQSVVSVHTEDEIHALADFMSTFADAAPAPSDTTRSSDDLTTEPYPRARSNTITSLDAASHSAASVLTTTTPSYSDSDHQLSSDGHEPPAAYSLTRPRPPRIHTDALPPHKSTPSLTSSASYSSLSTTGRYTSPVTPLTSSSELVAAPDLAIIDERYSDDAESPQHPHPHPHAYPHPHQLAQEPFPYGTQDTLMASWPQQKSNIVWATTRTAAPADFTPLTSVFEPEGSPSPVSPGLPPSTPRSAGGTPFSRFLSRTRKQSSAADQEVQAQAAEEKRLRKEDARARKEKARLEKLKRDLGVHPIVLGGMMALG